MPTKTLNQYTFSYSTKFQGDPSWYDSEFQSDKILNLDPTSYPLKNDAPLPCDSCPFAKNCEVTGEECVAFRKWSRSGKPANRSDLGRLLK